MKMNWCLSLPLMVILMLVSAESGDDGETITTETSPTCDAKYFAFSPTHSRCLTDNVNATLVPLSMKMKNLIVEIHNGIRARTDPSASNMMKLIWDDSLAKTAEKWIMQCKPDHDEMRNRQEPDWPGLQIGQNLGMGHRTFQAMINRFYTEKFRMNYTYGEGYVDGAGHYFQLVSQKTTRIGCAEARCPQSRFKVFRVCNYAPALNAAKPPYKSGARCADCPGHCDASGKLCDCGGKLCYYGGTLDPSTCQCQCQPGRTGDNCELSDCDRPDPFPSCRNGRYTAQDCGRIGTMIRDPNMCPHLCGICAKPCGGLECQNGGTLNWDTCQCVCRGRLIGPSCESCPSVDKESCTFLTRDQCQTRMTTEDCPIYCGLCNTTCTPCQNYGNLNTEDCSCGCKGGFTGPHCEICPQDDDSTCDEVLRPFCTTMEPSHFYHFVQTSCPYLCGKCHSS